MFGIGLPELIVILGLALIVVGPDKLPDLARSIAKGILELKKTAEDVKKGLAKEGGMFEDLRPELDVVKTLQKELAETTDIDWKEESITLKPSNGNSIEQDNALSNTDVTDKKAATLPETDAPPPRIHSPQIADIPAPSEDEQQGQSVTKSSEKSPKAADV